TVSALLERGAGQSFEPDVTTALSTDADANMAVLCTVSGAGTTRSLAALGSSSSGSALPRGSGTGANSNLMVAMAPTNSAGCWFFEDAVQGVLRLVGTDVPGPTALKPPQAIVPYAVVQFVIALAGIFPDPRPSSRQVRPVTAARFEG